MTKLNVKRYMLVQSEYGNSQLGVETDGGIKTIGSVRLPREGDMPCGGPTKDAESKAKERAQQDKDFCEMVVKHLNSGLQRGAMSDRMTAMKERTFPKRK